MWNRASNLKPVAIAVWHLIIALLLAYSFVIVLMISSSQAGVAERLARLTPAQDYSAAYALWADAPNNERRITAAEANINRLNAEIEAAEEERQASSDAHWGTLAPLHALDPELSAIPACDFDPKLTVPAEVSKALNRIGNCLPDANLSPAVKRAVAEMLAGRALIVKNAEEWFRSANVVSALERRRDRETLNLAGLRQQKAQMKGISESFAELSLLHSNGLPGSAILASFPPTMMQILLSFVSGLFGALLLTLVLIVYPKTDMKLGSTDQGYGPRILLGGLISLCVFVVIGGGTAVLGANNAFSDGEANYLALCAIGILAGMFSDRVAAWLSERADTFFKVTAEQAAVKAERAAKQAAAAAAAANAEAEAARVPSTGAHPGRAAQPEIP